MSDAAWESVRLARLSYPRGGNSFPSLENAVQRILQRFYVGHFLSPTPLNDLTPKQTDRNAEIRALAAAGAPINEIAEKYGISNKRVYQILKHLRK